MTEKTIEETLNGPAPVVQIEKTRLYKSKVAPEGSIFYVATIKSNGVKYSVCQVAVCALFTGEKEEKLKDMLSAALLEMVDNSERAKRKSIQKSLSK